MAGTYHITAITPICPPPNASIVGENESISHHHQTQSDNPVKAGCCARLRRQKKRNVEDNSPRKTRLTKAVKAQMAAYFRYTWIDSLVLAIFGIIILCLYWAPNNLRRVPLLSIWPAVAIDGNATGKFLDLRTPAEFQFPWQKSPLNDIVCAVIVTIVPIFVIGLFQIKICSTWDFHAGHVGVLKAVTTTALVVSILKHYMGGLRPHYVDVCAPNKTLITEYIGKHYQELEKHNFFNTTICTGNKKLIKNALQSFPSGHSANSFAAATFLALYMNAKLKMIGDHCSHYWAFLVTILPLLLASMLSAEMYITHQHHMRDIYAGVVLGLAIGMLAYRSVYAGLFDPRFNHIPLPPFSSKTQFLYYRDTETHLKDRSNSSKNLDRLVVWRWWTSGTRTNSRKKEEVWLRNIRDNTQTVDHEIDLPTDATLPQHEDDVFTMDRAEEQLPDSGINWRNTLRPAFLGHITSPNSPAACCA